MTPIPQPVADWLAAQDGLTLVLTVLGVMAIMAGLWKFAKNAFPGVKKLIGFIDALMRLPDFMASIDSRMDTQEKLTREVKHEVLPNEGGSMRDEMTTTGLRLEKVEAKLSKDYERLEAVEDELRIREERGIGISDTATSPRLKALPSRVPRTTRDDELEDTQQYPRPFPTPE